MRSGRNFKNRHVNPYQISILKNGREGQGKNHPLRMRARVCAYARRERYKIYVTLFLFSLTYPTTIIITSSCVCFCVDHFLTTP